MRTLAAALLYFTVVFGAGFVLGPVRVLWLEPVLGPGLATLIEAPFLVATMIIAAKWATRFTPPSSGNASVIVVGLVAVALVIAADVGVGFLRGLSPSEQLSRFRTVSGIIYIALLVLFAAMPALVWWRRAG